MNDRSRQCQPRPTQQQRDQRRVATQVNQLANRLPQVNQDFLDLAQAQLQAFNSLQRESRQHNSHRRPHSRSRSPRRDTSEYRQRPLRLRSPRAANHTPPTPRCPYSSPESPAHSREDSEMLADTPDPTPHSPTPSVIGWDSFVTENRQRQSADSNIPEYTERTRLPERHSHAPERPRYRGGFNQRGSQRQCSSQRGSQHQRGSQRNRQAQYTR